MPIINNTLLAGASGQGGGYSIDQSIRFDGAAQLRRVPSASDRRTWTWSGWVKRGRLDYPSEYRVFWSATTSIGLQEDIRFDYINANSLWIYCHDASGEGLDSSLRTNALFRDPSAWYHIVVAKDTTQATDSNRLKLYVNGEQVTSFSTANYPSSNYQGYINSNIEHKLAAIGSTSSASAYFDGYMAEINFVDGQQLAASDFGETNNDGVWIPKAYAGTYGTNGFYITGANSADLGADESGNGNNFTSSGLTASDQVLDSPTNNYGTFNPLTGVNGGSSVVTQANGNLEATMTANYVGTFGTLAVNSGKYYFEYSYAADLNYNDGRLSGGVVCVDTADHGYFRIDGTSFYLPDRTTEGNYMIHHLNGSGQLSNTGTSRIAYNTSLSSASATGGPESGPDIYMVALDLDNNNIYWGKNGTWYGSGSTSGSTYTDATPAGILSTHQGKYFTPAFWYNGASSGTTGVLNCGQDATFGGRYSSPAGDFYYTPPTGFSALSTANLPAPTIADGSLHFNPYLYTGDGSASTRSFTGMGFQPDFIWKKKRSGADHHWLHDAVRGATKGLNSNRTDSEYTSNRLTSFDSDGFSFATSDPDTNGSGATYVAWSWKGGNSSGSTNLNGSTTSTVSANTTAGFSIVTYTGTGSLATVGHGLGATPAMFVVKRRDTTGNWPVFQDFYGTGVPANNGYLRLNSSAAWSGTSGNNHWNDTSPTSSVFTVKDDSDVNASGGTYVAYCFANVDGFSKIGVYTGNGSTDGPFVWCGFRPAWFMTKRADSGAESWVIQDTDRSPYNLIDQTLIANGTNSEISNTAYYADILSNGFKIRASHSARNASGGTYLFMAFAEHPFGGDSIAPVPAR